MGTYAAAATGVLTAEGLQEACAHVWRDSNSTIMLGSDILNSEPVSYDDPQALAALKRHIAAAGPRAFVEDVLPRLGFGRGLPQPSPSPPSVRAITCEQCGAKGEAMHLGCNLCIDCCDCRP